jgi:DNA helicase-2/ATP-dependent DNA helicase PcrA
VRVEDEDQQAAWVTDQVLLRREKGLALRRQAVLFRTAHHSDLLELELSRRNVPFRKYGGLRTSRTPWRSCGSSRTRPTSRPGCGS